VEIKAIDETITGGWPNHQMRVPGCLLQ